MSGRPILCTRNRGFLARIQVELNTDPGESGKAPMHEENYAACTSSGLHLHRVTDHALSAFPNSNNALILHAANETLFLFEGA